MNYVDMMTQRSEEKTGTYSVTQFLFRKYSHFFLSFVLFLLYCGLTQDKSAIKVQLQQVQFACSSHHR